MCLDSKPVVITENFRAFWPHIAMVMLRCDASTEF